MFWSYCAYILFMVGVALGLTRHAAEPALWFLSMGWVLQMTVILLRALGAKRVRFPERAAWQKAVLGLALAAVPVLIFYRLKAELKLFSLLLIAAGLLWTLSLLRKRVS